MRAAGAASASAAGSLQSRWCDGAERRLLLLLVASRRKSLASLPRTIYRKPEEGLCRPVLAAAVAAAGPGRRRRRRRRRMEEEGRAGGAA